MDVDLRRLEAGPVLDDGALVAAYAPEDRSTPALRVNFVSSLDGAVELDGYSEGLSGPADKRVFFVLRMVCDALLVGAGTLRHEGYRAVRLDERRRAWRLAHGLAEFPTLVVVSHRLELDESHPALAGAPVRPVIVTHAGAPGDRRDRLAAVADVLAVGDGTVDLTAAVGALRARGLRQVLCEGGPHLLGALTAANLVDELCLTLAPQLAGPGAGRITAGTPTPPRPLTLGHALLSGDVLLLRYVRPPVGAPAAGR